MLVTGTKLGPYEIESLVGAGGMGEVYRASDPRLGRRVAVKVLPSTSATDPERVRRFEQEAHAAAALNHPNILSVYDIGVHESCPYIVSELLEGETLRELLRKTSLPARRAIDYAIQLARGLAAAHERGIVHRDLKPENIFVTSDGRVKILDFGLAKLLQGDTSVAGATALPTTPGHTAPGTLLGTMGYMAPEQVRGLDVDHRGDLFAFGAVLYEMLSGRRAFAAATAVDTISAILDKHPPDLALVAGAITPALSRIVERCLEKAPAARFQTAADLAFALEALSSHSNGAAAAVPSRSRSRGRMWQAATSLVALAALSAGALAYRWWPRTDPTMYRSVILPPDGVIVTDPGNASPARRLAISSNGRRLAFTGIDPDGRLRLWLRSLDAVIPQAVEGTEGVTFPFWSPDGRFVAFFDESAPPLKLKKIDGGGPPVTLCEVPRQYATGATWSKDDVILFGAGPAGEILRVPAAGGTPTPVTKLDAERGEIAHWAPTFLPDGRHFLYLSVGSKTGGPLVSNGVYVASLDSTERKLLLPDGSNVRYAEGYLLFLRGQTLFAERFDTSRLALTGDAVPIAEQVTTGGATGRTGAFDTSETGVLVYQTGAAVFTASGAPSSQLVWVDRTRKRIGAFGDLASHADLELAPDGKRAAVSIPASSGSATPSGRDIWIYDVIRGLRTRLTFDPADETASVWSPDATQIIFASRRKGHFDLYRKAASGVGGEELLFADDADKMPMDWSPDGRFVLFTRLGTQSGQDLWILPLSGGKPFPFVETPFTETGGRFSPDGRWVAYASNESSGSEVYVAPFPGPGGKSQISATGGFEPLWRRDGREIYFLTSTGASTANRLMAADVKASQASFEVGTVRPLFDTGAMGAPPGGPGGPGRHRYASAPDGQQFLMTVVGGVDPAHWAPITLVVNWSSQLSNRH
jgi:serine/threonine protein kinase/Tol biopolymer transport system component